MTLTEYNRRLEALSRSASERAAERIIVPAANRLLGNIKNRIQRRGQRSNGATIGKYSAKATYYRKEQFVKKSAFKPRGKKSKTPTFKNGRPRKSMYLEFGYLQLRTIQGRPTTAINLTYTGDLMASYKLYQDTKKVLLGFDHAKQARKRRALEKRFGAVFTATSAERKAYKDEVGEELKKITVEALTGFRV